MRVIELLSLAEKQIAEFNEIFADLNQNMHVTKDMIIRAVENPGTHVFALLDDDGRIIGTATLCVVELPTGRIAHVEAVVVKKEYQGQGLGMMLMEHVLDFASHELSGIMVYLTSNPSGVAANEQYKRLGFEKIESNVYRMKV